MTKGQKYKKKINIAELKKLRKQKKTISYIAKHFDCSDDAVNKAIERYALTHKKSASIRKSVKTRIQTKIFSEVDKYTTTAQGMMDEVSQSVKDNVAIKNAARSIIKDIKRGKIDEPGINLFQKAQDKAIERIKDLVALQRDLTGIYEIQKFMNSIMESIKILPYEYRKIFYDDLKKREIILFTIEQPVPGDSVPERKGDTVQGTSEKAPNTSLIQQD